MHTLLAQPPQHVLYIQYFASMIDNMLIEWLVWAIVIDIVTGFFKSIIRDESKCFICVNTEMSIYLPIVDTRFPTFGKVLLLEIATTNDCGNLSECNGAEAKHILNQLNFGAPLDPCSLSLSLSLR